MTDNSFSVDVAAISATGIDRAQVSGEFTEHAGEEHAGDILDLLDSDAGSSS